MMIESCEKLNNQAINLAASGDFEEAIACLKRAITIEKENYLLWFNLGITYRDAGDLQKAKEDNPDFSVELKVNVSNLKVENRKC